MNTVKRLAYCILLLTTLYVVARSLWLDPLGRLTAELATRVPFIAWLFGSG